MRLASGSGYACGAEWLLEFLGGNAYNFDSRLKIEQDVGFSETVDAEYETRGFQAPVLYLLRMGRWEAQRGWELSFLHHSSICRIRRPVDNVSISHGFNIVTVNRAWRAGDWSWRIGLGPVITHAEATI